MLLAEMMAVCIAVVSRHYNVNVTTEPAASIKTVSRESGVENTEIIHSRPIIARGAADINPLTPTVVIWFSYKASCVRPRVKLSFVIFDIRVL